MSSARRPPRLIFKRDSHETKLCWQSWAVIFLVLLFALFVLLPAMVRTGPVENRFMYGLCSTAGVFMGLMALFEKGIWNKLVGGIGTLLFAAIILMAIISQL